MQYMLFKPYKKGFIEIFGLQLHYTLNTTGGGHTTVHTPKPRAATIHSDNNSSGPYIYIYIYIY